MDPKNIYPNAKIFSQTMSQFKGLSHIDPNKRSDVINIIKDNSCIECEKFGHNRLVEHKFYENVKLYKEQMKAHTMSRLKEFRKELKIIPVKGNLHEDNEEDVCMNDQCVQTNVSIDVKIPDNVTYMLDNNNNANTNNITYLIDHALNNRYEYECDLEAINGDSETDPQWFPAWKNMSQNAKLRYLDQELDKC